jgi:hypothetical protein
VSWIPTGSEADAGGCRTEGVNGIECMKET